MALKRLDEEFELKPGTQLLPYMKRLLPSLEARFQSVESTAQQYSALIEYIRAAAVLRMNEILIPATEDIIAVTKLGFLLAPSSTLVELSLGMHYFFVDEGPQRDTFTPSPYLIVERKDNIDDYAIARLIQYSQSTGQLDVEITAWHGNPGPWTDWMISSTPGMADSTKIYHDAVGPMHEEVVDSTEQVRIMRDEIQAAAEALEEAGIDTYNYVRRDGTIPFTAPQQGVQPPTGSNDANFATTAWTRSRMIEYSATNVNRSGDTMTGPLSLSGMPAQPAHAASKAYVDSIIGAGGVINNSVTLRTTSPVLRLQSTGPNQTRSVESISVSGTQRWGLLIGDAAAESGGDAGSNFTLVRYGDSGALIDTALSVNRQTGTLATKGITAIGAVNVTGNVSVTGGELQVYRAAPNPNTGIIWFNQARTASHLYDGATHQITGGGINIAGPITGGHLTCLSVNTQGNPITTWGMTSHGYVTVNNGTTINGQLILGGQTSNMIQMYDTDWGPMYIHHNQDLIGYLNNGGGWIEYTTNAGHKWIAQYGWLHDYVNGRAYAYFQSALQHCRLAYVGDAYLPNYQYWGLVEDWWASVFTGFSVNYYYGYGLEYLRIRQLQMYRPDQGGWFSAHYA